MKNFKFKIDDKPYAVDIVNVSDKIATVNVNGVQYEVEVEQELKTTKTPTLVRQDAVPSTDTPPSPARVPKPKNGNAALRSPLPGKVIDILVKVGDKVSIGQTVVCIEAMKMENSIKTDHEGIVTAINVEKNGIVVEGDVLVEIE
jgi:glutaconyl-CoA/methylmalonyl-CoA decarboxylase subunit gamma